MMAGPWEEYQRTDETAPAANSRWQDVPADDSSRWRATNVTADALRLKGVPKANIAATLGNHGRTHQLISPAYGPGSTKAVASPSFNAVKTRITP
jgi:hypothetical protein